MSSNTALSDSVDTYLDWANQDSLKYEDRLKFNHRAMEILRAGKNDSVNRVRIFKAANRYYNLGSYEEYKKVSQLILARNVANHDTVGIAKSYSYLGDFYSTTLQNDSAFYYYSKAEKLYRKKNDKVNLGGIFINMARIKSLANDFAGSELLITQALTVLRETEDKHKVYEAYNILGYISSELKDYNKALRSYQTALDVVEDYNIDNQIHQKTTLINNIGYVYLNKHDYKTAIRHFEDALKDPKLFNDRPELYAIVLDNMAYSKMKLKNYSSLPHIFYSALKIRDSLNLKSATIYSKIHLSEYYMAIGDTLTAKKLAEEAHHTSKFTRSSPDLLLSLKQLVVVDPRRASEYSKEYMKIDDSLQQAERQEQDKFARIQFETDEISLEKDKLAAQNRNLFLFFGATVMIGLLLFVIRSQRARNRELLLKQAQQKANEDIYNLMLSQQNKIEEGRIKEKKRIAQELHDGVLGRLFGARLNLDSLNKMDGTAAEEKRNNYLAELKNIEQDIREISHDLNREKFVLINNFVAILNNLIEEQASSYTAEVHSNIDSKIKWKNINNNLKINLYRITQEALQNINKYAKATLINIEISETENNLLLTVSDNGTGFDSDKKSKGIGIQNMLTRTHECNGTFDIESAKGRGTTISISFPIKTKMETEEYAYPNSTNIPV